MSDGNKKPKLTPAQEDVLLRGGTERPFSGQYVHHNEDGIYVCVACGNELFGSEHKYDSNMPGLAGWPSFADVINSKNVIIQDDNSLGMHRKEVICANCKGHLGHVFDGDPDSSTGQHYCINSCVLDFQHAKDQKTPQE